MNSIQTAAKMKMAYIDLGKGDSDYKRRVSNGSIPLTEGVITVPSARLLVRRCLGPCRRYVERHLAKAEHASMKHNYGVIRKPLQYISRLERRLLSRNPWK